MARKPKTPPVQQAPKTLETLNDEQRQALFFQHLENYKQKLEAKKTADANFKNSCKLARSELGKNAIDEIKTAIDLDTEEGEAKIKDRIESALRVARWMGASLGTQFDMFGKNSTADKAFEEGKAARAKGGPRKPPDHYAATSTEYARWMDGYDETGAALNTELAETGSGERKSFTDLNREANPGAFALGVHDPSQIGTEPATFEKA